MIIQEGDKVIMFTPFVTCLELFGINKGSRYFLNGCDLFPLGSIRGYAVFRKVPLRFFVVAAIIFPVALTYCGGKVFPSFGVNVSGEL